MGNDCSVSISQIHGSHMESSHPIHNNPRDHRLYSSSIFVSRARRGTAVEEVEDGNGNINGNVNRDSDEEDSDSDSDDDTVPLPPNDTPPDTPPHGSPIRPPSDDEHSLLPPAPAYSSLPGPPDRYVFNDFMSYHVSVHIVDERGRCVMSGMCTCVWCHM